MEFRVSNQPIVVAISDTNKSVGSRVLVEDGVCSYEIVATERRDGVLSWETETEIKRDK